MKAIFSVFILLFLFGSCKKATTSLRNDSEQDAYFRFINIDGPVTSGVSTPSGFKSVSDVQLYLNGKINGNGDSIVKNQDGSFFRASTINLAPLGWSDLTDPRTLGAYGYVLTNIDSEGNQRPFSPAEYQYFPNPTHRIKTGPILSGINLYKWAALPAGSNEVLLKGVNRKIGNGGALQYSQGKTVLSNTLLLSHGAVYTAFLVNQGISLGFVPTYRQSERPNFRFYSNYGIYPDLINARLTSFFLKDSLKLVVLEDHLENFQFKDSTAYIRFLNATPNYSDASLNASTETIDVYVAPIFGATNYDFAANRTGTETLAAKNLKRFASQRDAPFFALDVRPWMQSKQDRPGSINAFQVFVYRAGESSANGNFPIARGDFLYTYYTENGSIPNYNGIDATYRSWLVRTDGSNYFPSITTVPLFVNSDGVSCGFRSIIAYEQAYLNKNYIHQ